MMATLNGAAFLDSQIESIRNQTAERINLLISDDGSTDGTRDYLKELRRKWPKGSVTVIDGPKRGFAENYRHLIRNSRDDADVYAFGDQDDLWEPDKLSEAADWLNGQGRAPALYCSRTRIVDMSGHAVGLSPLFSSPPSFRNAIVQSIAGGNTMVFNRSARELLARTCERTGFVSHDWWAYLMVTGAGGPVRYSGIPRVRYRQHLSNLVGANSSWRARMTRLALMAGGRFARWNERNLEGLELCEEYLTEESRRLLAEFREIRTGGFPGRLVRLQRSGIHRQTRLGQISLYAACVLGRM